MSSTCAFTTERILCPECYERARKILTAIPGVELSFGDSRVLAGTIRALGDSECFSRLDLAGWNETPCHKVRLAFLPDDESDADAKTICYGPAEG